MCGFVVDSVLFVGGRPCRNIYCGYVYTKKSGQQHFQVPGLQNENSKYTGLKRSSAAQLKFQTSKFKYDDPNIIESGAKPAVHSINIFY